MASVARSGEHGSLGTRTLRPFTADELARILAMPRPPSPPRMRRRQSASYCSALTSVMVPNLKLRLFGSLTVRQVPSYGSAFTKDRREETADLLQISGALTGGVPPYPWRNGNAFIILALSSCLRARVL